jgi:hypothetical protein
MRTEAARGRGRRGRRRADTCCLLVQSRLQSVTISKDSDRERPNVSLGRNQHNHRLLMSTERHRSVRSNTRAVRPLPVLFELFVRLLCIGRQNGGTDDRPRLETNAHATSFVSAFSADTPAKPTSSLSLSLALFPPTNPV